MKKLRVLTWLVIAVGLFSLSPGLRAEPGDEVIRNLQSAGTEWDLKKDFKKSGSEAEYYVKGKKKAVNISLRIFKQVPMTSRTYLEEVRKGMMGDPRYSSATMTEVSSQPRGGQTWEFFKVELSPELYQELWTRKLNEDVVLLVFFTAVGTYYDHYHSAFDGVLQQAAH